MGASFGILTSLLVAMLGQARYLCVIGRSNVVPAWFARVHPKTSTPVNASAFLGTCFYLLFSGFHWKFSCSCEETIQLFAIAFTGLDVVFYFYFFSSFGALDQEKKNWCVFCLGFVTR
jgi:amino acid transporter